MQYTDSITPALAAAAKSLADRRPILRAMGTQLGALANRSFNEPSQRAAPWAPLKPSTVRKKLEEGTTYKSIMKSSGLLWRSWLRDPILTNDTVTVSASSDRPYAIYLQEGTSRGLPARPMLPFINGQLTPAARKKVERIGQEALDALLRKATGGGGSA